MKITMMINRKSIYSNNIKTTDDLLMDIDLRTKCLNILNWGNNLKRDNFYEIETKETNDEIILLLQELGLINEINWDWLEEQSEKNIFLEDNCKTIKFTFESNKIIDFIERANGKNSVIKKQALEFIARHIGELDSGTNLVEFLKDSGAPDSLIVYPNTKWRMIYDVLLYYASMPKFEDRKILAEIIERASHPLMHNGDKNLAEETRKKFNSFLEYDNFSIDKNGVLWKEWVDPSGIPIWYDKDGNSNETSVYLIFPKKIDKLYIYWNELIKLTKFYFNNNNIQEDKINDIYFEIIKKIEETLYYGNGCGILKEIYKRPFGNIIGCEFEAQKQGLTKDSLLVKLYDFLNEITQCSLPDRKNIEKIKKEDAGFFARINKYTGQHIITPEKIDKIKKQPLSTKIEIIKMPELKIKGFEEKVILQKPKNKRIQLRKFPADTKWSNITVQFLNEHEVIIKAKNLTYQTNYEEMGFQDEKRKLPNKQWGFLTLLAFKNGEISWENNQDLSLQQINSIKKQKQLLTEALKAYFQIYKDEPFYDYKKEKAYKIKLNLVPESNTKRTPNEQEIFKEDDELGIKESYKEQTPEIYEE